MPDGSTPIPGRRAALGPANFRNPERTARNEPRAHVPLAGLHTLWFNTGTLCNIACATRYIESSPTNDRLAYLTPEDVLLYLDEIATLRLPVRDIGFTGGEPLINRALPAILEDVLSRGFNALLLTNAMQHLWQKRAALLAVKERHGDRLSVRVSSIITPWRATSVCAAKGAGHP